MCAETARVIPGKTRNGRAQGYLSQIQLVPTSNPQTISQTMSRNISTKNPRTTATNPFPMNLPNISKGISINASINVTLLTIKRANIVKKSEGLIDLAKLTRSSISSTPHRHVTSTDLHHYFNPRFILP